MAIDPPPQESDYTWWEEEGQKGHEGKEREFRITNVARGKHGFKLLRDVGAEVEGAATDPGWLAYRAEVGSTGASAFEAYIAMCIGGGR